MTAAMCLTEDDAALMYARACRAWYGRRAQNIVKRTIKQLECAHDGPGVRIWSRVADHLGQLVKEGSYIPQRSHDFD
jgi:hypothetical protein